MARVSPEDFPDPTVDSPLADKSGQSRAVLAGGCFWCVEAVYKNLDGVSSVKSGYAGGSAETYHQDYAARNPLNPYIVFNAQPKVRKLRSYQAAQEKVRNR